jgi:uncharacterized protein YyaL (SSP411 family)
MTLMNQEATANEPRYTNRLINETSPYLRQHAHNPVDWYPWGEEAIERARRENKPILLSIGYSACHWCHVMERESFASEEIARLMNENFINIKVDREERPDLDQIYMNAVQMMTGHGGWPLTVFLTPDLVPFYGGTYFPPEDRYGMPSFRRVLLAVAEAYRNDPEGIKRSAWSVLSALRRMNVTQASSELLSTEILERAYASLSRSFDQVYGGWGRAPKFPAAMNMEFLLRFYHRTRRSAALEMVTLTCRRMAEGGIYDQLGGGFHRYSTDERWLVPHFEKMLYDNALLSLLYLHVYQVTGEILFRRICEETLDWVVREMRDESGGFYSTQDADSEGEEGKFFVWTRKEIFELFEPGEAEIVCAHFGITETGNFEGRNVLHIARPIEALADDFHLPLEEAQRIIENARRRLFVARERRPKPGRDEKILTSWNGLMLQSFAEAAAILDRDDYREIAERNARFLLEHARHDGHLYHVYKDGRALFDGYLDDYAFLARGLLALYEATGTLEWLEEAIALSERMIEEFWDEEQGGFFYAGRNRDDLIVRPKDFFDNATPSGNSVAAELFLRLARLTGREEFNRYAVSILRLLRDAMPSYPSAFGGALSALDLYLSDPVEIVIIAPTKEAGRELRREAWRPFLPNRVLVQSFGEDERARKLLPLLDGRAMREGRPTAYVCQNRVCREPVTSADELAQQLA